MEPSQHPEGGAADDAVRCTALIEDKAKDDLVNFMRLNRELADVKASLQKVASENGVQITFLVDGYSLRSKKEGEATASPKGSNGTSKAVSGVPSIREAVLAGIEAAGYTGMGYADAQKHVQAVRDQDNLPSFNIHALLNADKEAGRVHKQDNGRWYVGS